jgi:hypothetical protein
MTEMNRRWGATPYAIVYDCEVDGETKQYHYHQHWRFLDFTFEDYTIMRVINGQTVEPRLNDDLRGELDKRIKEVGYNDFTSEEKIAFEGLLTGGVEVIGENEFLSIDGWATIDDSGAPRTIRAFTVNDSRKQSASKDELYDNSFQRARLHIRSSEDKTFGAIWVSTDEEFRGKTFHDSTKDTHFLSVQLLMNRARLQTMLDDVFRMRNKPVLKVNARALLFQDEVAAFGSAPWHSQEYALACDQSKPAIISHIRYDILQPAEHELKPSTALSTDLEMPPASRTKHQDVNAVQDGPVAAEVSIALQIRKLVWAMWVLCAVVLIAAIISN